MLGELGDNHSENTAVLLNNMGCCLAKIGCLDASLDAFTSAEELRANTGCGSGGSSIALEIRANLNRVLGKGVRFQVKHTPVFKFYWRNAADIPLKQAKK
jgi:hypothetical protein